MSAWLPRLSLSGSSGKICAIMGCPLGRPTMTIRVRALSAEEHAEVTRLARSRTLCAGRVKRAQLVLLAVEGCKAEAVAEALRLHARTVRFWLKRFNAHGLAGLEESDRPGRPPVYSTEQVGAVI